MNRQAWSIITKRWRHSFSYKEAIEKLNSLQSNASVLAQLQRSDLNQVSLPEMRNYLKRLGYEPKDLDICQLIHVTGTKGKGSTCAMTQSILQQYQVKTGLYTSPHLIAVRERIRINGKPISEEKFATYFQEVWDKLNGEYPVYFRYLTLVALHTFIREKVDCAILEVGIGGEYDSTNIIEQPVVCGITSLGLDHVNVLGNTIEQIAWHKAGIIKKDVPVVCFEQVPEAIKVVENRAKEKNAPLEIISSQTIKKLDGLHIGLAGIHQKYNALTAIELSKIWLRKIRGMKIDGLPNEFKKGLELVTWPGRGQVLNQKETKYNQQDNITWYLDGAHTIESLQVCIDWFKEKLNNSSQRILVFNCTHGRDSDRLLQVISSSQIQFDHVIFTTNVTFKNEGYSMDNTNTIEDRIQTSLAKSWRSQVPGYQHVHIVDSIQEAVELTLNISNQSEKVQVLTTGSLIMVGNTLTVLGIEPK